MGPTQGFRALPSNEKTVSVQLVGGHGFASSNLGGVERAEAEVVFDAGREVVVGVLLRMDAQIQALTARVARQDERIAQLERRLNRSSCNSSVPPSADLPASTLKRGKDRSGRKQGAQPGHEGRGRPLLPAWAVDDVIEHWPERCGCGHVFVWNERLRVGEPVRWQVEELPVIQVRLTEHQCHRVRCPGCGERPRGELPHRGRPERVWLSFSRGRSDALGA